MDKELLEYLRAMALEMSALAEEGNFSSLSQLFGMAALEAGQRLGPAIVFSQEAQPETRQEGPKEAPQNTQSDGRPSGGQRRPRPRRRRTDEPPATRGFRRSRKHPLHAAT